MAIALLGKTMDFINGLPLSPFIPGKPTMDIYKS